MRAFNHTLIAFLLLSVSGAAQSRKPLLRDKAVLWMTAAQAAAQTYDGITTRRFESYSVTSPDPFHVYTYQYFEGDPISRALLGPRPTWARMAPIGTAEVFGSALLAHYIRERHSWVRHLWWIPQAAQIGISVTEGTKNLRFNQQGLLDECRAQGHCQ